MLRAIAYRSVAAPSIESTRLDHIVRGAQRFNRLAGVTGAMLFDGARFLQYIEGPVDGVEGAIGRIKASNDHTRLEVLEESVIQTRRFPAWDMSCLTQPNTVLDHLFVAPWGSLDVSLDHVGNPIGGLQLLRHVMA
ncbi:BLUF domain-containing protein [Stenotrophomonas sp.]|uniref:BLUF domain-containing protein n=1 Tax=Stenotrophomonas sp. TaxID=69392 RepID=UPI00289B1282|nr:BLUF domain-containing protein [Stenotrophomonas sp.]